MQGQVANTSTDTNKDVKPTAAKGKTAGKSTQAENTNTAKKASSAAPSVDGVSLATLQAFITKHEGVAYHTYSDSRGFPTAGIGHLLPAGTPIGEPVSKEQVAQWFQEDVNSAIHGAQAVMGSHFNALNPARKCVVIDMVFNLGETGFAGFHNTIAMIESGNYSGAASGMLQSLWASQVGGRATEDANIMRTGVLSGAAGSGPAPAQTGGGSSHAPTTGGGGAVTIASIRDGKATLQEGSRGAAVETIQHLLHITTDGDFGPETKAAVESFQRAHHLTVDGCVGEHTIAVLDPVSHAAPPEHGGKGEGNGKSDPKPTSGNGKGDGNGKSDPKPTTGGGKGEGNGGTKAPGGTKPPKGYTAAPGFTAVREGKAEIKEGMAGDSVKYVQQKLHITADGEFGPATKSAVEQYQLTHKISESGVVGRVTANAIWDNKKATGKTPVQWAGEFVNDNSWQIHGLPGYNNLGRVTNNCAEFVSSCLYAAGWIPSVNDLTDCNVGLMSQHLRSLGWKVVGLKESQPNDVWISNNSSMEHTELIAGAGGSSTIGSDGTSTERILQWSLGAQGFSSNTEQTTPSNNQIPASWEYYILHKG